MTEFTTPDFIFRVKDDNLDLTEARHVYLTMKQGNRAITKSDNEMVISGNQVSVWLYQEEISAFKSDYVKVEVQLNWTYDDASGTRTKRAATTIKSFKVSKNLLRKVLA